MDRTTTVLSAALLTIASLGAPLPALAELFDTVTAEVGHGDDQWKLVRLNLAQTRDQWQGTSDRGWEWKSYWEADLGYWYLDKADGGQEKLLEIGLTPNFRLQQMVPTGWGRIYLEGGVGVHLLSQSDLGTRDLSTAFHFGSHLGIGMLLGSEERYDLSFRAEHLSNAGIEEPNPGINFAVFRLGYRL